MNKHMKSMAVALVGLFLWSVAPVQAIDLAVTQATSTTTAVTANGGSGVITTFNETAAAGVTVTFTVNNTGVKSSNAVLVTLMNYSGTWVTNGDPIVSVGSVSNGSFTITITNVHASNALSGTIVIGFLIV